MTKSNARLSSDTRTAGVIVSIVALSFAIAGMMQMSQAQQIDIDVTAPANNNPYGGERLGTISITPEGHLVQVVANMTSGPGTGNVYEGWFVDAGGSDYKLSLGEFAENGTLQFNQQMVIPIIQEYCKLGVDTVKTFREALTQP